MQKLIEAFKTALRFVFFRASTSELNALGKHHLAVGFFLVWLAGIGRHWDDEGASLLQSSGAGSLVYVFFLAGYLWLMIWPLRPRNWSYLQVLAAICLTAPPALLYAIPIERWLELETSQVANLWALGIVALWRVALFVFFLVRSARLHWWRSLIGVLFPLNVIVCVLGFFMIAASITDSMAGTRNPTGEPVSQIAETAVMICIFAFVPLLILYAGAIGQVRHDYTSQHE